ncbi:DUF4230 domain-containing protein [Segatella buccae]|uniref:DUF4230 domain-containing protein n=1 Tax=Segatella buccae ATCC 33574 TaxID=873513 RepID=E6K842_9BACT|nr:DUF4230 domain-containing protein [Segatella buccae]EFU30342.1 hypothetical protein HMPREF6485_1621 [Segatella buccae ATCC 33574]
MKRIAIHTALLAVLLLSCSKGKTPDGPEDIDTIPLLVMQIQKCSKLYTSEFRIHKIVTHDDKLQLNGSFFKKDFSINLPAGKRKVAIPMDATLKTYIDFTGFSEKNVRRQGKKIEITLPDPKVDLTSTKIDHKDVKQYVALTRSNFTDEELANYEQQGRQAIINDIARMDIMEQARQSAANTLIPLIEQMGYEDKDITVTFRKEFTPSEIKSFLNINSTEYGKAQ